MGELPWDDEEDDAPLCPICGAYSPRACEERGDHGGECPWQLMTDEDEP